MAVPLTIIPHLIFLFVCSAMFVCVFSCPDFWFKTSGFSFSRSYGIIPLISYNYYINNDLIFTLIPSASKMQPFVWKWFQLRSNVCNVTFSSMILEKQSAPYSSKQLCFRINVFMSELAYNKMNNQFIRQYIS